MYGDLPWASLVVELDGRRAIYDERFPKRWADAEAQIVAAHGGLGLWDYDASEAAGVLAHFAANWPTLPERPSGARWVAAAYEVTGTDPIVTVPIVFVARTLSPTQIVVTHVLAD